MGFRIFKSFLLFFVISSVVSSSFLASAEAAYPSEWWIKIPESDRKPWEILPQDALPGEVILSKRTELGIFSNLGATPFDFEGVSYASIEALWQMMKYPEAMVDGKSDIRKNIKWPRTRADVLKLSGFESKAAGDEANKLMTQLGIKWVSYKGQSMVYKDNAAGSAAHYEIIYAATLEKIRQNESAKQLLLKTKGLKLRLDHKQEATDPPSYRTNEILMQIRDSENLSGPSLAKKIR